MSGLKISFEKSEIILIGGDNLIEENFVDLFNCQIGSFLIKYMGVHISASSLKVSD
jgi:hypothetical protein